MYGLVNHYAIFSILFYQAKMKIINALTNLNWTNLNWQSRRACCHRRGQRGARSTFSFNDSDLSWSALPNSTFLLHRHERVLFIIILFMRLPAWGEILQGVCHILAGHMLHHLELSIKPDRQKKNPDWHRWPV